MKKCNNCGETRFRPLYDSCYKGGSFYGEKDFALSVSRCARCGLVALDLNGNRKDRSEMHESWWERTWLRTYSRFKDRINRNYKEKLKFLKGKVPGRKMLDVGCGCGFFLSAARREGWDAVGVDIAKPAVDHARGVLGQEVFHSTIFGTDFPDDHFDLVTMWDVLEHLDDPSGVLGELRRILRPEGLLVIETPNVRSLIHRLAHASYKLSLGRFKYFINRIYIPSHLFYFSKRTLADMLRKNGFVSDMRRVPLKSLFDDVDMVFSANEPEENWARSSIFKALAGATMKFSDMINMPYRLVTLARKGNG